MSTEPTNPTQAPTQFGAPIIPGAAPAVEPVATEQTAPAVVTEEDSQDTFLQNRSRVSFAKLNVDEYGHVTVPNFKTHHKTQRFTKDDEGKEVPKMKDGAEVFYNKAVPANVVIAFTKEQDTDAFFQSIMEFAYGTVLSKIATAVKKAGAAPFADNEVIYLSDIMDYFDVASPEELLPLFGNWTMKTRGSRSAKQAAAIAACMIQEPEVETELAEFITEKLVKGVHAKATGKDFNATKAVATRAAKVIKFVMDSKAKGKLHGARPNGLDWDLLNKCLASLLNVAITAKKQLDATEESDRSDTHDADLERSDLIIRGIQHFECLNGAIRTAWQKEQAKKAAKAAQSKDKDSAAESDALSAMFS